jgi:HD-like signal output (HDOD) protein
MTETAESFVKRAKELPVMPPIAAEVMKKAEDPDTSIQHIAQLIARDASLAVRVLKIANSSFYSMPRKIETLQQAILLLGYSTLRSVVIAASVKDVFARFGLAERLLWEHAVGAGVAASLLAKQVPGFAKDDMFVGGLVHDVGKLVMHSQEEHRYQEVMRRVYSDECEPVDAEREVFGFDHAEVGELVLGKWNIPARLASAVGSHHDPMQATAEGAKPLAAVLQVADRLCLREGLGRRKPNHDIDPLDCMGAEILGVRDLDIAALSETFLQAYDHEREVFS